MFNLENGYNPGISIYTKKLLNYRYEWVKQGKNAGLNPKSADWSKKSEDYYNARKELNELGFIYNSFLTDDSNKIFDVNNEIGKHLSDKFSENNVLFNQNTSKATDYIIKFRFSQTSGLDINNLDKYIEITHDKPNQANGKKMDWTLRFNLQKMKNDFGNLNWLTDKKFVFDLNGLHDFFDVTYQTFWEKVLGILDTKGLDTTGLVGDPNHIENKNQTFKKDNILTKATSKNINNEYLYNQKGWVEPVVNTQSNQLDYLLFKSIGEPITEAKDNLFAEWGWLIILLCAIIFVLLIIIIVMFIKHRKSH